MKSEPEAFSIDDLARKKRGHWDGVRNYQARNNMKAMAVGDLVLFHHSSVEPPGVAGVARVCRTAYPDFTAWDKKSAYYDPRSTAAKPVWEMVDVEFIEKFPHFVSLEEMRGITRIRTTGMTFTRGNARASRAGRDARDPKRNAVVGAAGVEKTI